MVAYSRGPTVSGKADSTSSEILAYHPLNRFFRQILAYQLDRPVLDRTKIFLGTTGTKPSPG